MKINTNLVKILSDLAKAAESGGINVSIDINVNVSSTEAPSIADSPTEEKTSTVTAPQESTPVAEEPKAENVEDVVSQETADNSAPPETQVEQTERPEAPAEAETKPEPAPGRPAKAADVKPQAERARPRPMVGGPTSGSSARVMKMCKTRQKQLSMMDVVVPDSLMREPANEQEAQQMLDELRPYMTCRAN